MDLDELDAAPRITDILVRTFNSRGGRTPRLQTIGYLTASESPEARAFLKVWRELPVGDKDRIPLEAVCIAAKVSPLAILGAVLMSAKNLKAQESALKAIIAHPDVIDATVRSAKTAVGFSDRKMLHEAVGFLPTKQGSQIAINLGLGKSKDDDDEGDDEKSWSEAFPTIAGELESWGENRRKLTDGK